VDVTVGLVNPQYVEIRAGLKPGDQVIYAGYETLRDGDPVVAAEWGPNGAVSVPPATGVAPAGVCYTCKMHPDVKSDHPGTCPNCGMTLSRQKAGAPAAPAASAAPPPAAKEVRPAAPGAIDYTCPMHPEVHSDHPGSCPKCGMELVLAKAK
jgi:hypothetical protein